MSGLLVKSTVVMRENLEEMTREGIDVPVLLGGAALTRSYVEDDCVGAYGCGRVAYARDAFDGLDLMDKVVGRKFDELPAAAVQAKRDGKAAQHAAHAGPGRRAPLRPVDVERGRSCAAPSSPRDVPVPAPPFWGARVIERVPLKALVPVPQRAQALPVPVGLPEGRASRSTSS